MKDRLTNNTTILSVKLKEIQQLLWVVFGIDERGGVETRHGVCVVWRGGEGECSTSNLRASAIVALKC